MKDTLLSFLHKLKRKVHHLQEAQVAPEQTLEPAQEVDDPPLDPFLQELQHSLADLQQEQEERDRQWLAQIQQDLAMDAQQRASLQEHDIPARTFASTFRGLQHWFARKSLRDLKIVLFLFEASQDDATRTFSLDELAHGLQMARSTMQVTPIDGGLIASGVIRQTRHGRAGYRYRSGLLAFLHETLPAPMPLEPLEPLIPLLMYDTIKQRTKKPDPWLLPWLERAQAQDLHSIQERYHL